MRILPSDPVPTLTAFLLAALLLSCGSPSGDPASEADDESDGASSRPNIVLIMTDDQGYGDLGAHGHPVLETPNLDSLYRESVRLTDYHVDPTCSPTRAALLTGRYSSRTGVWHTVGGRSLLLEREETLADVLGAHGYRTGLFGKWHLGDNAPFRPWQRGFDRVVAHGGGGIGQTPDFWGNDYFDDTYWVDGEPRSFTGYCTEVFFEEATRFIAGSAERDDRPFFAYISTNVAHSPRNVADRYAEPYLEAGVPENLARFYGMITEMDGHVGALDRFLERRDLAENTVFIFTTDNGTAGSGYNAGLRGRKGSVYEGGHRVPFFIRYPEGEIAGGRDVETLTAHVDVLPTLIDLAGIEHEPAHPLDGRSLTPLLRNQVEREWPNRTLFVHSQRIQDPEKGRQFAVMTERWRLLPGPELYDVRTDSGQTENLAAGHPEVVDSLQDAYDRWWTSLSEAHEQTARIHLGDPRENPTRLTAHDWHAPTSAVPWNQNIIREDPSASGPWSVEVVRPGRYRFRLRRRPDAVDRPLRAEEARIRVGDATASTVPEDGAEEAVLELELDAGPTQLRTELTGPGGETRGAYYVWAERIGPRSDSE